MFYVMYYYIMCYLLYLQVHQIGKTTDESSYMIGRFNTDNNSDVSVQLFGQEIINLRKKDQMDHKNNKSDNNRRYVYYIFNYFQKIKIIIKIQYYISLDQIHLIIKKKMLTLML